MLARSFIVLLVGGAAGFFLDREERRGTLDTANRLTLEWIEANSGTPAKPAHLVMVELTDGDLPPARRAFDTWPPAPLDFALLFESLARRRPATVAVLPVLTWTQAEALDLSSLAERVTLLPRAVLAVHLQKSPGGSGPGDDVLPQALPRLTHVEGDVPAIPEFGAILSAPPPDVAGSKPLGFSRIDLGERITASGGSFLLPMLARHGTDVVPSFVLQTLMTWKAVGPDGVKVRLGHEIEVGGDIHIPVDSAGRFTLFVGIPERVSRADAGTLLFELGQDEKWLSRDTDDGGPLKAIPDSVVLLGDTTQDAPHSKLPGGASYSDTEIFAQALARIQSGRHILEMPSPVRYGVWAASAALGALQVRWRRRRIIWAAFLAVLALIIGALLTFQSARIWLPFAPPAAILATVTLAALVLTRNRIET